MGSRSLIRQVARCALFASLAGTLWCVLTCAWVASALAFSEPDSYLDEPENGGGGGRWFTGSPAEGYGCGVCHTGSAEQAQYPLRSEGFPTAGYVPGQTYELRMFWPEFSAREQQIPSVMGAEPPSMGLIAEFVAESGIGSGMLEVTRKGALPDELCTFPPNSASSIIYHIVPGADPAEVSRCEANSVGERCVVAVKSCGARELRVRWTAPPQAQDSVWFSAGFVATDRLSRNPQRDSVTEIAGPLRPVGGASTEYETTLDGGCSVGPNRRAGLPPWWLCAAAVVSLVRVQRRRRTTYRRRATIGLGSIALLGACAGDPDVAAPTALVGLYSPGNALGTSASNGAAGAEATTDADVTGYFAVPPGDRCLGVPEAQGAKGGTLSVEFKTVALNQLWGPANVGAVWIEDAAENYIKTLELWADVRRKSLYQYGKRACQKSEPDVVSRATLPMPGDHKVMWNGKDLQGRTVPDGLYRLFIEVTETEADIGRAVKYEFPKGPMPAMLQPPDAEPHQGLKVTYTPVP